VPRIDQGETSANVTDAVLAADHLIGHFVDQARRSGASWTDTGRSMGVTKRAAQKRFVAMEPLDPGRGFNRCTDRARNVVAAQKVRRQRRDHHEPPGARPAHRADGLPRRR
jgi:hypothetical protein